MLVVMQLKMTPEMSDKIRQKLAHLQTLTTDPDLQRKLNLNNLVRFYIDEGMHVEPPLRDEEILAEISNTGMARGRPTQDS